MKLSDVRRITGTNLLMDLPGAAGELELPTEMVGLVVGIWRHQMRGEKSQCLPRSDRLQALLLAECIYLPKNDGIYFPAQVIIRVITRIITYF